MKIRKHLESLPPYTPIEPFEVLSTRIGRSPDQIVKLDANENPYGPLPAVREALGKLDFPHIYPDPESRALRKPLSTFTGIGAEYLLAGQGADELIDLLMRVFLEPDDCILSCPPTFGMYAFDAELNAARCIEVPRKADFSLDMDAIRKAVETYQPKLFFITSPNNPDGSLIPADVMDELLSLPTMIVLDEAYIEFAGDNLGASLSRIREVPVRENLIVLRTFSTEPWSETITRGAPVRRTAVSSSASTAAPLDFSMGTKATSCKSVNCKARCPKGTWSSGQPRITRIFSVPIWIV